MTWPLIILLLFLLLYAGLDLVLFGQFFLRLSRSFLSRQHDAPTRKRSVAVGSNQPAERHPPVKRLPTVFRSFRRWARGRVAL